MPVELSTDMAEEAAKQFEHGIQTVQVDIDRVVQQMCNEVETVSKKHADATDLERFGVVRLKVRQMKLVLNEYFEFLNEISDDATREQQKRCIELYRTHKFVRFKGSYDDHAEFTCIRCGFVTWNDDADKSKTPSN